VRRGCSSTRQQHAADGVLGRAQRRNSGTEAHATFDVAELGRRVSVARSDLSRVERKEWRAGLEARPIGREGEWGLAVDSGPGAAAGAL
jgi:hypothetical protein